MSDHDPLAATPRAPDGLVTPVIDHEPAVVPEPAPAAPLRARSGGTPLWLTLLLVIALAGGGYTIWANPKNQDQGALGALSGQVRTALQDTTALSAQMQAMSQQVQALSDRVDKLEKAPPPPPPAASADLGDLPKRLDDLSAKVATLESQPAAAAAPSDGGAGQQAVAALSQKLDQLASADKAALDQLQSQQKDALDQAAAATEAQAQAKTALAGIDVRLSKLEQGAGNVEDAASRATRLERIQAAVVALQAGQKLGDIPGAPPALSVFANQAPPTEAALRDAFPALAAHASAVSQPDTAHKSFLQRAFARLQQSVTVREGNEVLVGDPAAGLLSEAGIKVQNGDLPGAVAQLRMLNGPALTAMQGWIDQAQSLIAARAALASLAARG